MIRFPSGRVRRALLGYFLALCAFEVPNGAMAQDRSPSAVRPILHLGVGLQSGRPKPIVVAVSPEGQQLGQFEAFPATWSPDGAAFAFLGSGESQHSVNVMDLKGEARMLFVPPKPERIVGWHAAWSPDGQRIAFITAVFGETIGESEFAVTSVDAKNGKLLARHPIPRETLAGFPLYMFPPDKLHWSPDSRRLLISWGNAIVLDMASGKVIAISRGPAVAEWGPDSNSVYYFEVERDGPDRSLGSLFLRRLDQSRSIELADEEQIAHAGLALSGVVHGILALSPNGSKLAVAFGINASPTLGTVRIYSLPPGGGFQIAQAERSFETGIVTSLDWAPDGSGVALIAAGTEKVEVIAINLADGTMKAVDSIALPGGAIDILAFKALSWSQ